MSLFPLPLELAQPIPLSGDLDTLFRANLRIGKYDPKTQMNFGAASCETSSDSSAESNTSDSRGLLVIDSQTDAALADDFLQDFQDTGVSDTSSQSDAQSDTTDTEGLVVIDAQTDVAAFDDFLQDFQNG
jgi:hypothetical protein